MSPNASSAAASEPAIVSSAASMAPSKSDRKANLKLEKSAFLRMEPSPRRVGARSSDRHAASHSHFFFLAFLASSAASLALASSTIFIAFS
jgi:hypothetical protein